MKSLMPRHIGAFALLALLAVLCGWSQQSGVRHELRIQYRLGYRYYDGDLDGNQKRLDAFLAAYRAAGDSLPVVVTGSASPEGGTKWRGPLARKRAEELIKVLERNGIPASRVTISDAQVNWKQLRDSVAANPQLPWTEKVLEILDAHEGDEVATKRKLHAVDRDRAWKYMLRHYFPPMRYGLAYFDQPLPPPQPEPEPEVIEEVREVVEEVV